MTDKIYNPKLPSEWEDCHCVICGEKVTAPPFIASKPRRGKRLILAHTACLEQEQQGGGEV